MKKLILLMLLMHFAIIKSEAQVQVDAGLRYGIGLNFPTKNIENGKSRFTALNFIGFTDIHVVRFFSIQPELQYYNVAFRQAYDSLQYNYNVGFFGINLIPKFNVQLPNGYMSFYTGVGVDFPVAAKSFLIVNDVKSEKVDIKDKINSPYVGGIIGISTNQNIWEYGQLVIDTRYTNNFNNFLTNTTNKAYVHQLAFSIGYVQKIAGYRSKKTE